MREEVDCNDVIGCDYRKAVSGKTFKMDTEEVIIYNNDYFATKLLKKSTDFNQCLNNEEQQQAKQETTKTAKTGPKIRIPTLKVQTKLIILLIR